jgi:hypothetical protein
MRALGQGAECLHWVDRAARVLADALATVRCLAPFAEHCATIPETLRVALGESWDDLMMLVSAAGSPASIMERADEITASCAALGVRNDEAREFFIELSTAVEHARQTCAGLVRSL